MKLGNTTLFHGLLILCACFMGGAIARAQDKPAQQDAPPAQPESSPSIGQSIISVGADALKEIKKQTREGRRAIEDAAVNSVFQTIDQGNKNKDIAAWETMKNDPSLTQTQRDNIQRMIDQSKANPDPKVTPSQILESLRQQTEKEKNGEAAPADPGDKKPTAQEVAAEIRNNIKIREKNDAALQQAINESPDPPPAPAPEATAPPPNIPPASPWTDEGLNRDRGKSQEWIDEINKQLAELRALQNQGRRGDKGLQEEIEKKLKERGEWGERIRQDEAALEQNRINRNAQQQAQQGNSSGASPGNPSLLQGYNPNGNDTGGDDELAGATLEEEEAAETAEEAEETARNRRNDGGNTITGQGPPAGDDGDGIDDAFAGGVEQGAGDGRMAAQHGEQNDGSDCNDGDGTKKPKPNKPPAGEDAAPPPSEPATTAEPEPKPPCGEKPCHFPGDGDGC